MNFEHIDGMQTLADLPRPRHYFGYLQFPRGMEVGAWIEISHSPDSSSPIRSRLRYPEHWRGNDFVPFGEDRVIQVRLVNPMRGSLRFFGVGSGNYSGKEASFSCHGYDLHQEDSVAIPDVRGNVCARLTSGGLLRFNRIPLHSHAWAPAALEHPNLCWEREGVQLKLALENADKGVSYGQEVGVLTYQHATVRGRFKIAQGQTAQEVLDRVEAWLEFPLLLLGFLSREAVHAFEILVEREELGFEDIGFTRRSEPPLHSVPARSEKPLFSVRELDAGDFSEMLRSFERLDRRVDLARAIRYHLASYRHEALDTSFILAIAALETLVTILEAQSPMPDELGDKWGALRERLADEVASYGASTGMSTEAIGAVQQRLNLLRSGSFSKKVNHQVARLGASVSGLWLNYKSGQDEFEKGLSAAYARRSALVHNTVIRDGDRMVSDLARIQNLFERLAVRTLVDRTPNASEALSHAAYASRFSESGL